MPVKVRDLLEMSSLGLRLAVGRAGTARAIRWVHTSELADPTEWLSGGELLLTTGMGLRGSPDLQRAYVERLVEADLAGLGLGLGFEFEAVPEPVREVGEQTGFPIVEVPYPVPFIAISEAVLQRFTEERLRDAEMSVEIHERLTKMVTEGAGPERVLTEVVKLASGWAALFDLRGEVVAAAATPGVAVPHPDKVWADLPSGLTTRRGPATAGLTSPEGTRVALAVTTGPEGRPEAALVFGRTGRLEQRDRIVVHHAVSVLGLLLASRRAIAEAERRLAGDVLSEAFSGASTGAELERRLDLAGFGPADRLTVLVVEGSGEAMDLDKLAWAVDASTGARTRPARVGIVGQKVAALVAHEDPAGLAATVLEEIKEMVASPNKPSLRIGVGQTVTSAEVRSSYLTAVFALRSAPAEKAVALQRDLGSYAFLLGAQRGGELEPFVRSVLGPLIDRDHLRSSHLVDSVRAYIEAGGRWEQGAEDLGIHRHTLRYRVRQAEDLLARDLADPEDRLEVWLALKAAEVLRE